jgi:hypothetical protein
LIPQISDEALNKIQQHFSALVLDEAGGIYKPETTKIVDVRVMREVKKVYMPVPGMYGVSSIVTVVTSPFDKDVGIHPDLGGRSSHLRVLLSNFWW